MDGKWNVNTSASQKFIVRCLNCLDVVLHVQQARMAARIAVKQDATVNAARTAAVIRRGPVDGFELFGS